MPTPVAAEVGQSKQVESGEQQEGQRQQRRVGDPGRREAASPGHGHKVGDNRQRECHRYPPVRPTNPGAGTHVVLLGAWIIFQPLPPGAPKPATPPPNRSPRSLPQSTPPPFHLVSL